MVKKINNLYQCEECFLFYDSKEIAKKCENFCKNNHACNIDIIKHAIKNPKS
ncbi:MAG: hypothetical protein KatS3mg002_1634 [Candidatus Woesearchaeota archaeon]|nr:MAG: hypothetical protein KatS3mg002_1634 [Candidatus Woesearchaeota archaeon]